MFDEISLLNNNSKNGIEEVSYQITEDNFDDQESCSNLEIPKSNKNENCSSSKVTNTKFQTPSRIIAKWHPKSLVIGDKKEVILTRRNIKRMNIPILLNIFCLISEFEPKIVIKALNNSF